MGITTMPTWLLLLLWLTLVVAVPYATNDKKALLYFPDNNFYILGKALLEDYKKNPHSMIRYEEDPYTLDMITTSYTPLALSIQLTSTAHRIGLRSLTRLAPRYTYKDKAIEYSIPRAFTFGYNVSYVLTAKIIPLTGVCNFQLMAENVTYRLLVTETEIVPSMSIAWRLEISDITNSIALALGVRGKMQNSVATAIGPYWDNKISAILLNEVQHFYADYFGSANYYVHFPHLRSTSITLAHKFLHYEMQFCDQGHPILRAVYDQRFDPIPYQKEMEHPGPFIRSVELDLMTVVNVLKWEMYLTVNTTLTADLIPASSYFKADLQSLTGVFPDLQLERGNRNLTIVFNGYPTDIECTYDEQEKVVKAVGLHHTATVYLADTQTPLFESKFYLSLKMKPYFTVDPNDIKRVYLNLQAIGGDIHLVSAEKTYETYEAIFHKEAIVGYLEDLLHNYLIKYYSNKVLGSGLLLSFGFPLAVEKTAYESITGRELVIYLYSSEF